MQNFVFLTLVIFAFPSGDWQREIGCAEAKVRTCHFQCPDNYWPNAKKAVPLQSHSALESQWLIPLHLISGRPRPLLSPKIRDFRGPQERCIANESLFPGQRLQRSIISISAPLLLQTAVCRRGHLPALTGYPSCTEGCDAAKIGPSGPCRINLRFAASLLRSFLRGCA